MSGRKSIPGRAPRSINGFNTSVPFQDSYAGKSGSSVFREYHNQQIRDSRGRFAGGWGYAWQGLSAAYDKFTEWADGTYEGVEQAMESLAERMEQYAKDNHPWQNRTGDAEKGLHAEVVSDLANGMVTIWLGHGVHYGVWLEVRNSGQFAILVPTLLKFAPEVAGTIKGAV